MSTRFTTLCDFYLEYEHDSHGYGYLRAELRAPVCGASGVEVVVGSGGLSTAIVGGKLGAFEGT